MLVVDSRQCDSGPFLGRVCLQRQDESVLYVHDPIIKARVTRVERSAIRATDSDPQSPTATASISISHSGAASAETPTSVLAGGSMPSKKAERALPMIGRSSGL